MGFLRVPGPFPGQPSRRGPHCRKTPPFPVSYQADEGRRKRGRPIKTINTIHWVPPGGSGTEGRDVVKPWVGDRLAQVSPRAEFYGLKQQQLRHSRRLAGRPGEPPPASAALGQSLKDLEGGSRLPPDRKNLLRLRFS